MSGRPDDRAVEAEVLVAHGARKRTHEGRHLGHERQTHVLLELCSHQLFVELVRVTAVRQHLLGERRRWQHRNILKDPWRDRHAALASSLNDTMAQLKEDGRVVDACAIVQVGKPERERRDPHPARAACGDGGYGVVPWYLYSTLPVELSVDVFTAQV